MKITKKQLGELAKNLNASCVDRLTFEEANALNKLVFLLLM